MKTEPNTKFDMLFEAFLLKWCKENYPHLVDSDENDGQELRDYVNHNLYTHNEVTKIIKKKTEKLVAELRSKNPMTDKISKDFGDNYNQSFDNGYCKCVDELEKLLKEERK